MSANRFAEAEAAFQAGRGDEGKRLTADQLNADPDAPAAVYRNFGAILVRDRDYAQAESVGRRAVERHSRDPELWNILGVALRRLKRYPEAIEALEKAARLSPRSDAIQQNLGNVFNDARDGRAIKVFSQLVRSAPSNAEHQRQLGRAHWFAKDFDKAIQRLNLATRMKPDMADAWLDLPVPRIAD
jgi:Flp pilus assembly protein TadD